MKTNFSFTDGLYIFLFLGSFALSLWLGDLLKMKILASNCNHKLSVITGTFVEILVTIIGIWIGVLLIKIL